MRLLALHPTFRVTTLTGDRQAGKVGGWLRGDLGGGVGGLVGLGGSDLGQRWRNWLAGGAGHRFWVPKQLHPLLLLLLLFTWACPCLVWRQAFCLYIRVPPAHVPPLVPPLVPHCRSSPRSSPTWSLPPTCPRSARSMTWTGTRWMQVCVRRRCCWAVAMALPGAHSPRAPPAARPTFPLAAFPTTPADALAPHPHPPPAPPRRAVFCCLPHATTQEVMAGLPTHVKVVDLSADFRLRDVATYAEWWAAAAAAAVVVAAAAAARGGGCWALLPAAASGALCVPPTPLHSYCYPPYPRPRPLPHPCPLCPPHTGMATSTRRWSYRRMRSTASQSSTARRSSERPLAAAAAAAAELAVLWASGCASVGSRESGH